MQNTKTVYIDTYKNELVLFITVSLSGRSGIIKLSKTTSNVVGLKVIDPNKLYYAPLSEHNIMSIVHILRPLHFDIADNIMDYYYAIQTWVKDDVAAQFSIENNTEMQQLLSADLGPLTDINPHILADRRIRYQYTVPNYQPDDVWLPTVTLTSLIASRPSADIWIDSKLYSVTNLIDSLIELERLPLMLVFNVSSSISHHGSLELFQKALSLRNITEVGIYFRSDNKQKGRLFNQLIASSEYNKYLDDTIKVAGVDGNNLPKFFLTSSWKPMSVISLNSALGYNKPSVYANSCDLRITYSQTQPILKRRYTL